MITNKQAQQDAADKLRELFPAVHGDVYTVVRHVTSSGMGRTIQVLATQDPYSGKPGIFDVSYLVQRAGLGKLDARHPGVKVNGTGMDMAFHLVYTLSQALYGDGYALTNRSL